MFDIKKDERYIRMCRCPEVQNHRKLGFEEGDILANYRKEWIDIDADNRKAKRILDSIVIFEKFATIYDRDLVIWLPRQSDIQAMLGFGKLPYVETQQFYNAICGGTCSYFPGFRSFEQLWLAFYMEEIHKKIWDGKWRYIQVWNQAKNKWENAKPERRKK